MDNMFAGMGLGDFINKDKNTALVNSMIAGPDKSSESKVSIPSIAKSSSNMSLQEKRKILQQQEAAKSVQPPVAQTPADSLIAKSLSMNQMSGSTNWSSPAPRTGWNSLSVSNPPSQGMTGAGFGNFSQAQSFIRPTAQKPDLSAFDNLLSPSSGGASGPSNKLPMNSIGGKI